MTPSGSSLTTAEVIGIVSVTFTVISALVGMAFMLGRYSVRLQFVEKTVDNIQGKMDETKRLILDKIEALPCHTLAPKKGC